MRKEAKERTANVRKRKFPSFIKATRAVHEEFCRIWDMKKYNLSRLCVEVDLQKGEMFSM